MPQITVGGLTPLTSTDYPGHLAAVIFCQGCPWNCGYCHNPHLIPRQGENSLEWEEVLKFLRRRQGLLDAVVFSGGEPTLQTGLVEAVRAVRELGFKIGLHTGGPYPSRLRELLPWLDWVGFDIKAPFEEYAGTTRVSASGKKALSSARLILESGVSHEFRTTVHPELLPRKSLLKLVQTLAEMGVRHYVLQEFRPQGCADEALISRHHSYLDDGFQALVAPLFETLLIRRV